LNCQKAHLPPDIPESPKYISILALGDSYTKGESVPWAKNFPNQLADSLRQAGYLIKGVRNIAQTGWRTDQLQAALNNATDIADSTFDLVTLCIGVNNQYQNGSLDTYKIQFENLLQRALARAGGKTERVLVVSIPDWAFTPYGQNFSPGTISQEIDQFNTAKRAITESYGVDFVNVTPISRMGLEQPELVAPDGLHPSAGQYSAWVQLLFPAAKNALRS
jgi:lysophospholipase L1-like esterase